MSLPLLKPLLYQAHDTGAVLLGGRCVCGYTFFPMQTLGCEQCGKWGDALTPVQLRGSGKLVTASVVHIHADKRRSAPFAIGTIALDDGPVIRTLLADTSLAGQLQSRVRAKLAPTTQEDGTQALDLRFGPEGA